MTLRTADTSARIQLGVLVLRLRAPLPIFIVRQAQHWTELHSSTLQAVDFQDQDEAVVKALQQLLREEGVSFGGEVKTEVHTVLVRCWLVPHGGRNGGQRPGSGEVIKRERALGRIFGALLRSWDDGGRFRVMDESPEDSIRMSGVYASIPSPPEPSVDPLATQRDSFVQSGLANYERPSGVWVSTTLHRYQIRSIARMLRMETRPEPIPDPQWIPLSEAGREGTYYLKPKSFEVRREVTPYPGICGGILNEDMGTGKTLMALTLILASLHQPCKPPRDSPLVTSITNDLRERTYPFPADCELRSQVKRHRKSQLRLAMPSLVDMCVDVLTRNDANPSQSLGSNIPHLKNKLQQYHQAFYVRSEEDLLELDDSCRRKTQIKVPPKRLLLANTTLVVCPAVLVGQWMKEIDKHVEAGRLNVLRVGQRSELPAIEVLMEYDVVIMSVTRFAMEHKRNSVLESARWKRIFLDEGHVAGLSKVSNSMMMAKKLSIERRWAISGTPTKNLQQGGEQTADELPEIPSTVRSGPWTIKDIADVTSLGMIIGTFLGAEPFRSTSEYQDIITTSLRLRPSFGAVPRLRALLSILMVKHMPRVIDAETLLPPCTHRTELLDFHPMGRKTYNALIAIIAANVYTSEANDRGYLLSPENAVSLNQTVANLHLACFWYSAREMDIAGCLRRTKAYVEDGNFAPEVIAQLEQAVHHLQVVTETPGWDQWMHNAISVPFDAGDLPEPIRAAWSDSPSDSIAIDLASLLFLRGENVRGSDEESITKRGAQNKAEKAKAFETEVRKGSKRAKGTGDDHATAAKPPTNADALTARMYGNKRARLTLAVDVLPDTLETVSRSAKVNFISRTILEADPADQFVIFGDKNELGHVRDALDLFEIMHCYGGRGISEVKREEALREFQKPEIRVCLLDLNVAARGLNLVNANRMILLAPIWSPDTLAQVVKRIHRIGQTGPTTVQTLVMRGTIEEDIVNREGVKGTAEEEILYSRSIIMNPRFVSDSIDYHPPENLTVNLIPLHERVIAPVHSTPPPNTGIAPLSPATPDTPILRTPHGAHMVDMEDAWVKDEVDVEFILRGGKREAEESDDERPEKRVKGVTPA